MPNFPDPSPALWQQGGYENHTIEWIIAGAANIRFGANPSYALSDFLSQYPQFGPDDYFSSDGTVNADSTGNWPIPQAVLQLYINLASASIASLKWCDWWQMGMGLFIAHFATLWAQSSSDPGSSKRQIAGAGLARGLAVSESAGDVSINYESVAEDLKGWAAFKLTAWGQMLATLGSVVGLGNMYVW